MFYWLNLIDRTNLSCHYGDDFENVSKPDFINRPPSLSLDLQNHKYIIKIFLLLLNWFLSLLFFSSILHVWKHIISFHHRFLHAPQVHLSIPFSSDCHDKQSTKNTLSKYFHMWNIVQAYLCFEISFPFVWLYMDRILTPVYMESQNLRLASNMHMLYIFVSYTHLFVCIRT